MGTTRLVALQDAPAAPQLFTGSLQQHFLLPPPSASTAIQATMKWTLLLLVLVGAALVVVAVDDESDDLVEGKKGNKGNKVCRYTKGAWSPCDPATNQRTRSLALKKGDTVVCQSSKTITKKCKKAGAGRRNRKN